MKKYFSSIVFAVSMMLALFACPVFAQDAQTVPDSSVIDSGVLDSGMEQAPFSSDKVQISPIKKTRIDPFNIQRQGQIDFDEVRIYNGNEMPVTVELSSFGFHSESIFLSERPLTDQAEGRTLYLTLESPEERTALYPNMGKTAFGAIPSGGTMTLRFGGQANHHFYEWQDTDVFTLGLDFTFEPVKEEKEEEAAIEPAPVEGNTDEAEEAPSDDGAIRGENGAYTVRGVELPVRPGIDGRHMQSYTNKMNTVPEGALLRGAAEDNITSQQNQNEVANVMEDTDNLSVLQPVKGVKLHNQGTSTGNGLLAD